MKNKYKAWLKAGSNISSDLLWKAINKEDVQFFKSLKKANYKYASKTKEYFNEYLPKRLKMDKFKRNRKDYEDILNLINEG